MGLFGWLFGGGGPRNVEDLGDRIWLSREAKFAGIARDLLERSGDAGLILLVAHFPDSLAELQTIEAQWTGAPPVQAVLARRMSQEFIDRMTPGASSVDVIVAERHPLLSEDQQLVEFLQNLPVRCRLVHHGWLNDPLMSRFGGPWVESVLKRLGIKEDEAIDSEMVSRRVQALQKKLQRQSTGNTPADSAEQWMAINLPPQ